ncbi:MAG TPA: hypothetical protein VGM44_08600 [Polyangiaceae bacterium]|jgi:hypothetical protein
MIDAFSPRFLVGFALAIGSSFAFACSGDDGHGPTIGAPTPVVIVEGGSTGVGGSSNTSGNGGAATGGDTGTGGTFDGTPGLGGLGGSDPFGLGGTGSGDPFGNPFGGSPFGGSSPFGGTNML